MPRLGGSTVLISLQANPAMNAGCGRPVQPDIRTRSGLVRFLSHGCPCRFHVAPRHVHLESLGLPCSAIVSGLRVIAVAHVKRGSRIGSEQTAYPIRAHCMANTRRIFAERSVLDFTNKRRISLGGRPQWRIAFRRRPFYSLVGSDRFYTNSQPC